MSAFLGALRANTVASLERPRFSTVHVRPSEATDSGMRSDDVRARVDVACGVPNAVSDHIQCRR